VTFSSEVNLSASAATDGTQLTYNVGDLSDPSGFDISATGVKSTEAETESWNRISSLTTDPQIAGNAPPENVNVTFEGTNTTSTSSWQGTIAGGTGTDTISVSGTTEPLDESVTFTGTESTAANYWTSTNQADGDTKSISVGGNLQPENAQVTFTGNGFGTQWNNYTATGVSTTYTESIDVNGAVNPTAGSIATDPELTVEATGSTTSYNPLTVEGDGQVDYTPVLYGDNYNDGPQSGQFKIEPDSSGVINSVMIDVAAIEGSDNGEGVDITIEEGGLDDNEYDGTTVADNADISWQTGEQSISLDSGYEVTAGQTYTITFLTYGADGDGTSDQLKLGVDDSSSGWSGRIYDVGWSSAGGYADIEVQIGESATNLSVSDGNGYSKSIGTLGAGQGTTTTIDLSSSSTELDFSGSGSASLNYDLTMLEQDYSEDPSVDIDGDGAADVSYTGTLSEGETATGTTAALSRGQQSITTSVNGAAVDWELTADEVTATEDPELDVGDDGITEASHTGILRQGETATKSFNGLGTGSQTLAFTSASSADIQYDLEATTVSETTGPAVDFGGDGSDEASYTGTLTAGETYTESVSLSSRPSTVAIGVSTGNANVSIAFDEVTTTPSGNVSVNGHAPTTFSALAPGSSTGLPANASWIEPDQNTVDITMDTSSLSADAPAAKVGIDYSHTANEAVTATVSDEKWTQRYEVTRTWGANHSSAYLTVPLKDNVVQVRDLKQSTNGGAYSSVNTTDYTLNTNTSELEVRFSDVTAGENVTVVANMSKVQVQNGEIDVVEPTLETNTLNSRIELVDWQQTSFISVGGTTNGNHTLYTANESWSPVESVYYVDAAGNRQLQMPNAGPGATTRVRSTPLMVSLPNSGEAKIEIIEASDNTPRFRVEPGVNTGDTVRYELLDGRTDGTHILFGSDGDQLTSGDSRVLTYNDTADTYEIKFTTTALSSGGGGGGILATSDSPTIPIGALGGTFVPLSLVALALAGLVVASRNDDAVQSAGNGAATTTRSALDGIPVIGPAAGGALAGAIRAGSQFGAAAVRNRTVTAALGGAVVLGAIQLGIVEIPEGSGIILIVAGIGIGSVVALREVGEFSTERWAAIVTAATIIAIQTQSDASILSAIVESQVFPIVVIGGLYLLYRFVQGIQQPNNVTEIVVGGDDGGDN